MLAAAVILALIAYIKVAYRRPSTLTILLVLYRLEVQLEKSCASKLFMRLYVVFAIYIRY